MIYLYVFLCAQFLFRSIKKKNNNLRMCKRNETKTYNSNFHEIQYDFALYNTTAYSEMIENEMSSNRLCDCYKVIVKIQ